MIAAGWEIHILMLWIWILVIEHYQTTELFYCNTVDSWNF